MVSKLPKNSKIASIRSLGKFWTCKKWLQKELGMYFSEMWNVWNQDHSRHHSRVWKLNTQKFWFQTSEFQTFTMLYLELEGRFQGSTFGKSERENKEGECLGRFPVWVDIPIFIDENLSKASRCVTLNWWDLWLPVLKKKFVTCCKLRQLNQPWAKFKKNRICIVYILIRFLVQINRRDKINYYIASNFNQKVRKWSIMIQRGQI